MHLQANSKQVRGHVGGVTLWNHSADLANSFSGRAWAIRFEHKNSPDPFLGLGKTA
jgi:hypothetical protein